MQKSALIVCGGWQGHEPRQCSDIFADWLKEKEFEVTLSESLDAYLDKDLMSSVSVIVPVWTMGEISREQTAAVSAAVANGTGIAGCHGGMCDAFRTDVQWQFITGGNWVSHPGGDGVEYTVNIRQSSSPIVEGIGDFQVKSEQYYLHVDPAVEVLAVTRFPTVTWYHSPNGAVDMPVVWTKRWGLGRVYYNSLGHHADTFDIPEALELMRRGFLWAAEGKDVAIEQGLDSSIFRSERKMF